ncbi:MAG: (E)-4-hydroxy-3-methylbut-2-enyl-diphosphate synthase [Chlamydiales bacterium]|jgi:(E)-4-hydroxy-3-methylbut-2-enyl-diphosphate synthase
MKYCESIWRTKRRPTREVMVGNVGVGGDNPVRIQSMTTSDTRNVEETVEQIIRLVDSGCDIVRITVQGMKEAKACEHIKNSLIQKGYTVPLVADIHFYPPAAMTVVEFVDKVRVNPGNFVDKRATFKSLEYDDETYHKEILRIEEKFGPLVEKCKKFKRALRIGTNHGSLSDRIMNRYGDTPEGMVESAIEFANVCRQHDFHDFMFSMKASNTRVMISAYRLLAEKMYSLGWDYPIHLGVTEAGEGEDGRVKSAIGMGSLLLDGLGDTLRVSLTEDPWEEIDPCQRLVKLGVAHSKAMGVEAFVEKHRVSTSYHKRESDVASNPLLHRDGTVVVGLSRKDIQCEDFFVSLGCLADNEGLIEKGIGTVDAVFLKEELLLGEEFEKISTLQSIGVAVFSEFSFQGGHRVFTLEEAQKNQLNKEIRKRFDFNTVKTEETFTVIVNDDEEQWAKLLNLKTSLIFFSPKKNSVHQSRKFFDYLQEIGLRTPVLLSFHYCDELDDVMIQAAAEMGSLLCDGLGDGVMVRAPYGSDFATTLSFNILQGSRLRTVKTEFISCPSCGRTLFNLQEVASRIREKTSHLPGVKIAIMGCIVNGPGEMADADFGYVGSRTDKIDLYVGKECVEKNIDFDEADERLIELIKAHGRWEEPQEKEVLELGTV